jgi:acyl-CoA reductase-like NAD-dependent aldehyde dehydrogenase
MGKPFRETQGEVDFSADILDFYAGKRREISCS